MNLTGQRSALRAGPESQYRLNNAENRARRLPGHPRRRTQLRSSSSTRQTRSKSLLSAIRLHSLLKFEENVDPLLRRHLAAFQHVSRIGLFKTVKMRTTFSIDPI